MKNSPKDNVRKRILIDGRLLSDSHTGISRYTSEMIRGAQRIWGYDMVTVIIKRNLDNKYFNYVETRLSPFNMKDFFFFHKFLEKQQFDLLFSPFYANSFFKVKDKQYVSVVHDLMYALVPNFFSANRLINFLGIKYYNIIVRKSLKNSDKVITVSETTRKDVISLFECKSLVFSEGINILKHSDLELNKDILERNNLKKDSYFLYVGIDRPHKNIPFLCSAYLKSNSKKKLVLCGKHKTKYDYPNVVDLGYVCDEDLEVLYRNASSFIFPSKYEGFGLPILEALSLQTKVISSNSGALSEFDGKFVKFFDVSNEQSLINAMKCIDDFSINYSELINYLNKFDWNKIADNIMIYCHRI